MKSYTTLLLGLLMVSMLSNLLGLAFAGQKSEELQGRQDIQYNQIQQGMDNGSINQHEAQQLIKGQNKIDKTAHKDMKDDKLTRREYHKLEHMQNKESKNIENKADNNK